MIILLQVINVDPDSGELIRSVPIPASRVTSVTFGGPKLDILYVTTSRLGLSEVEQQQQPLAGSVFAVTGLGVSALAPANNVIPPISTI
jgi:gluconolactonase